MSEEKGPGRMSHLPLPFVEQARALNDFASRCYGGGGFDDRVKADTATATALQAAFDLGCADGIRARAQRCPHIMAGTDEPPAVRRLREDLRNGRSSDLPFQMVHEVLSFIGELEVRLQNATKVEVEVEILRTHAIKLLSHVLEDAAVPRMSSTAVLGQLVDALAAHANSVDSPKQACSPEPDGLTARRARAWRDAALAWRMAYNETDGPSAPNEIAARYKAEECLMNARELDRQAGVG